MAMRWTDREGSTIRVVDCPRCGCCYRYEYKAVVIEKRSLLRDADAIADEQLAEKLKTGRDLTVCPSCRYMDPKDLATGRRSMLKLALILAIVPACITLFATLVALGPSELSMVTICVIAVSGLVTAGCVGWGIKGYLTLDPTKDPKATEGLEIVRPGVPEERWGDPVKGTKPKFEEEKPAAPMAPPSEAVEMTCPSCTKKYKVKRELLAKKPGCKNCKVALEVDGEYEMK